ncbi:TrwH protein [Bartonella vinsonii]|uniref:TrwH protein n=1 Tax=Bartonella vinsonii subsp. berkhoffii str. Tweed TaxID=1094502 RepID=N6VH06_BARVB|nr:TrwH protein [Bartonella vinsonii]ENN93035.1 TrwH protein [Bartonella vinsonii subsp. berkhoffii str. Tweed]
MKSIVFAILIASLLSACTSAPQLKKPSNWNRVPVNKTVPAEIQRETI